MNILHTETLKGWGGQQNRVLSEAAGMMLRGHKVTIVCNSGSEIQSRAIAAGLKVYDMTFTKKNYFSTIPGLVRIIRREAADIVCTHSSVDSWAGAIAAKITGAGLIRFRHNLYTVGRGILPRILYSMPDRLVVLSSYIREGLLHTRRHARDIAIIPSAIDPARLADTEKSLRGALNLSPDTIVIGNTSTFSDVKGQEYLMQAFNLIHRKIPCILLFAGDIDEHYKDRYLHYVDETLRDRVIFLGHRDDIPEVLNTIDVFVYPSLLEGQGTALIEAMASGRPVAVSDIPTFRDFIDDNVNGTFFQARDPESIASRVIELIKDGRLRDRLGAAAVKTVQKTFSIQMMLDRTEQLYQEVLDAR